MTWQAEKIHGTDEIITSVLDTLAGVERNLIFGPIEHRWSHVIPERRKLWIFRLISRKGETLPISTEMGGATKKAARDFRPWLAEELSSRGFLVQQCDDDLEAAVCKLWPDLLLRVAPESSTVQ
jgi:hypothetical protein